MALITCKECGTEVSSTAKTCPKCGARVAPKSNVLLWVIGTPVALLVLFLGFGASIRASDPLTAEKDKARARYELCMSDLNDPLKDQSAKDVIIRPVCARLRDEFTRKYGREP